MPGSRPRGEPPPNSGSFSAARLRRAVPTGGRRSLACASLHADQLYALSLGSAQRCRPEVGVVLPTRHLVWAAVSQARKKLTAANSVRCRRDRGESVKGGLPPPVHKKVMTNRNSPKRAEGAQGSFDCRREAPGGSGAGAQFLPTQNPNWSSHMPPLPDRSTLVPTGGRRSLACASPCREGVGVALPTRHLVWAAVSRARKNLMAANSVRCPRFRGNV